MPSYTNPQNLNRYSYVINNPLSYTDPTGHSQCRTQEDCDDLGAGTTPMGQGPKKPKIKKDREHHGDVDPDPNPNGVVAPPAPSWFENILAYQYTPVAAGAVQVLSATVFTISFPFVETPIGLVVTIGAFAINRTASFVGLASTFYQYDKGLYGTNFTDVTVSGGSFILGWIPALSEGTGIASLLYSAYRLEHEAPINIPAPNSLR